MRVLEFKPEDKEHYLYLYIGCIAATKNLSRPERRVHEKILNKLEAIGISPTNPNKPYTMVAEGGTVILEDAEFNLAKELSIECMQWPPGDSRKVNALEDWLDKAPSETLIPK